MPEHVKVFFRYDGSNAGEYETESMWAIPRPNGYELDNIPFYVKEVALGDVVHVTAGPDGELWFRSLVRASGHSTVRLWFEREDDVQAVRDHLRAMGCESEVSDRPRLVAVDVPPEVPYATVKVELDRGEADQIFEYEEGCLGQAEDES